MALYGPDAVVVDAETGERLSLRPHAREERLREEAARLRAAEEAERAVLLGPAGTRAKKEERKRMLLSLQRRQHEYLQSVIDEEVAAEKAREVQWRTDPLQNAAAKRLLRSRFDRERAAARDRITRISKENELVLVHRMIESNLLR
jgi:isocitrate/isopropylmalate dehydrogenase